MKSYKKLVSSFLIPIIILSGIALSLFVQFFLEVPPIANLLLITLIFLGSYKLFLETGKGIIKKQYELDYIAVLAVIVSLITGEFYVGAIIALMIAGGETLEAYGVSQAKESLTKLVNRIPRIVTLWGNNQPGQELKIEKVKVNQLIFLRKGEVVPLDGILVSENGQTDESSLTGEPYMIDKEKDDLIRSGTINIGAPMVIKVTKAEKDSTYKKIIAMVQSAQKEKAPLIRLADKYSTYFTIITLLIASVAFLYSHSLTGILAVLVIATPCPLIIATPIALLGGMNAAARKRIIVKKLASIEILSHITTIVFDKTGTLTLGKPVVSSFDLLVNDLSKKSVLSIAGAIERNSLHPLAKAVVSYVQAQKIPFEHATDINEELGKGISATIDGKHYLLGKALKDDEGMNIILWQEKRQIAQFTFTDEIKKESANIVSLLRKKGMQLLIFTGDKKKAAEQIASQLGNDVVIHAELSPLQKKEGIDRLQESGKVVAMIGDGINDAPALASADVGMVFSNEEQTAASEAADIVLLGGDFALVVDTIEISSKTIKIAMQSILWGIGMSVVGMTLAAFGLIPPLLGAGIQEGIDIIVIVNALRASRIK